jgi:tripartite-type tricarboxylate transporter receptor subunit TctC
MTNSPRQRRHTGRLAATVGLSLIMSGCAGVGGDGDEGAAGFPSRDIRLTVPFTAGGGFDAQARVIAPCLGRHLPGEPTVIVENKPGAEGLQALQQAWDAKPDGHTLVQVPLSGAVIQQFVNPDRIRYDVREMEWIGQYQQDARAVAVDPSLNVESWDDLTSLAEKRPIRFAGTGRGTSASTEASAFSEVLDLPAEVIEYEGSNEILGGFIRDEVDATIINYTSLMPWQQDGEVDILLLLEAERRDAIADVPTAVEAGVPEDDFDELMSLPIIGSARAFAAPPGTPEERVEILRNAFSDCMEDEEFIAYTESPATEIVYGPMSGEDFDGFVDEKAEVVQTNLDFIARLYG